MKQAFIKLHLSILLAGWTGVFGRLISLNEGLLVWYRLMLASVLFFLFLAAIKKLHKVPFRNALLMALTGCLLALHWIFFYGSIKASNVSIGVVCFSSIGFFTAFLEPWFNHQKVLFKEIVFSLLTLLGITLIFSFDTRYRVGIGLGIFSSLLCALYTLANKKVSRGETASTVLLYQFSGGFIGVSCLLPFYLYFFPVSTLLPSPKDCFYLVFFVVFCTLIMYILQIQALKKISAFTVNLSYNLEPVYSIIIAMIIFKEAKDLNVSFYFGIGFIILSVLFQSFSVLHSFHSAK